MYSDITNIVKCRFNKINAPEFGLKSYALFGFIHSIWSQFLISRIFEFFIGCEVNIVVYTSVIIYYICYISAVVGLLTPNNTAQKKWFKCWAFTKIVDLILNLFSLTISICKLRYDMYILFWSTSSTVFGIILMIAIKQIYNKMSDEETAPENTKKSENNVSTHDELKKYFKIIPYIKCDLDFGLYILIILGLVYSLVASSFFWASIDAIYYFSFFRKCRSFHHLDYYYAGALLCTHYTLALITGLLLYLGFKEAKRKYVRQWYNLKFIESLSVAFATIFFSFRIYWYWFGLPAGALLLICGWYIIFSVKFSYNILPLELEEQEENIPEICVDNFVIKHKILPDNTVIINKQSLELEQ